MRTVFLLILSNAFMTVAWYGHLRFRGFPLWSVIVVSWLIALPEYAFQVPANRFGHGPLTATQLKVIQEVVSLGVFVAFAWWYFGEAPTWRTLAAFALIAAAVALVATGRPPQSGPLAPRADSNQPLAERADHSGAAGRSRPGPPPPR